MPMMPPWLCVTPDGEWYKVGAGMKGVWLAGLMNPQPIAITSRTIDTLMMTMIELTTADSWVPRISSAVRIARMNTAGTFMMPCTPVSAITSNGECVHSYGIRGPNHARTRLAYSLHAIATVAAPTAYSSTRSQPMIQATSSPMVAYENVYALPAIGIIDANSA